MIADYNTMPEMFSLCNRKYFNGSLPTPKYGLMNSLKYLARFKCNRDKKGKHPIKWQQILFSDCFDFPEDAFHTLMVHELIHYYIKWNGIKDNRTHGKVFMAMANEINEKYGLNITKTVDASSFPRTEKAAYAKGWFRKLFMAPPP